MDGLQVDEQMAFQRRTWRAERIGWVLIALVVTAALAGLLGPGPLSHSRVESADGALQVDYQRFARSGGTSDLDVTIDPALARDGLVEVRLARAFLDSAQIEGVTPAPDAEVADAAGTAFAFAVDGEDPVTVRFHLRPQAMGSVHAEVAVTGGPRVGIPQLYYP